MRRLAGRSQASKRRSDGLAISSTWPSGARRAQSPASRAPAGPDGAGEAVIEARLELRVAELGLAAARAELQSVERRAAAMRAAWNRSSRGKDAGPASADEERRAARAAARAEREHAAARERVALAEAELRLHRAAASKKEAISKEVVAAREALDKAVKSARRSRASSTRGSPERNGPRPAS